MLVSFTDAAAVYPASIHPKTPVIPARFPEILLTVEPLAANIPPISEAGSAKIPPFLKAIPTDISTKAVVLSILPSPVNSEETALASPIFDGLPLKYAKSTM